MEKYTRYSILVIILFSIIVLSLTSIYHVSGDGCWHIPVGKFIANNAKFPLFEPLGRDEPFWSPPLYHVFVAFVYYNFNAFSHNLANFAVKFIPPIFGILSIIFSFLIVKKLINSKIAFYSTLFLAFIPIFIDYGILSYAESMLVFFVVLSVYFLVNNRLILSGITAGLAMLTKYNGILILPVLVYLLHKRFADRKKFYKNASVVIAVTLLIAAPWLIRNWMLLGNPIWPFLNFIFKGFELKSFSSLDLGNLVNSNLYISTYLGFFGVPDGNYSNLTFFDIPYFSFLFVIWLIGTIIFIMPLLLGIFKAGKKRNFLIAWIGPYLLLFFLYAVNVSFFVSRMMLPALPAIAIFWAFGYEKLLNSKFKKIVLLLTIAIALGFVATEAVKIRLAANAWHYYDEDFNWVKQSTKLSSVFIANGQCVPYNIERKSLYANEENINQADYIWLNQNFKLDIRSTFDEKTLNLIQSEKYKIAYSNEKTGTIIYSTKQ